MVYFHLYAAVAELADALDSGSSPDCQGGGSSPFCRTKKDLKLWFQIFFCVESSTVGEAIILVVNRRYRAMQILDSIFQGYFLAPGLS